MTYRWSSIKDFVKLNLLEYPSVLYRCNISEILLYNQKLFIIVYDIKYAVRAAHYSGEIIVKQDYYILMFDIDVIVIWMTLVKFCLCQSNIVCTFDKSLLQRHLYTNTGGMHYT